MTERFRLTCYKNYLCTLPSCVFDGGPGKKECEAPLNVTVTTKMDGNVLEPAVIVQIEDGGTQDMWLPSDKSVWHKWEQKIDFKQRGFCELSAYHSKKAEVYYECAVSKIDEADEAKFSAMKKTHPKIWGMIEPYLDEETNLGLRDRTFRELAVDFLNAGSDEQQMFPYVLIETSNKVCMSEYSRMPYYSPTGTLPQCLEGGGKQMEQKICRPDSGGYDKYQDTDEREGDRGCFWNTLFASVPLTPFAPDTENNIRALELGCGAAVGAAPLVEFLRRYRLPAETCSFDESGREVQYTGVDLDKKSIEKARTINPPNFTFIDQDASRFLDAEPDRKYDVILFRHPGPMLDGDLAVGMPDVWEGLMRKAYEHLSPGGILIVSALLCEEYFFAQRLFADELGAAVYVAGKNPLNDISDSHSNRDQFLLIVGKTSE